MFEEKTPHCSPSFGLFLAVSKKDSQVEPKKDSLLKQQHENVLWRCNNMCCRMNIRI